MGIEDVIIGSGVIEREDFDRETTMLIDRFLSRQAAVARYRLVRKYCRGIVVDAACGCGYGSWLISKCPAVTEVIGFDVSEEAVAFARTQYGSESVAFETLDLADWNNDLFSVLQHTAADTIVSLETIEHMKDATLFLEAVAGCGASRFVVTFPSFDTVCFNPYHLRDWTPEEVERAVGTPAVKTLCIDDAVWVMVFDL